MPILCAHDLLIAIQVISDYMETQHIRTAAKNRQSYQVNVEARCPSRSKLQSSTAAFLMHNTEAAVICSLETCPVNHDLTRGYGLLTLNVEKRWSDTKR